MRTLFDPLSKYRALLGRVSVLALAGLTTVGCEHSQDVLDLVPSEADGEEGTGGSGQSTGQGDGGTEAGVDEPPIDRTVGITAAEALAIVEGPIGSEANYVQPVIEEDNRMSCSDTAIRDTYSPDPALRTEAQGLLSQMTIDQKVIQLTGVDADYNDGNRFEDIQRSQDDEVLNLRGYLWRDGPHGLNLESGQGRDDLQNYSTSFPTSVAQGATFDLDLVDRVGAAIADETVALGDNVLLGPCMNVLRHPYWGRAQETFGEDTFHLGRIGTAFTYGLQQYISGCAKHYTANNIENERFDINAGMDEQTLREVYGRHFEMVVRDGGVGCIMAAYNSVQGTKSTQNKHTLTEMLRDDMGFLGFVLTDWWAMPGANTGQGPVDAPQDRVTAAEALEAGLDVEVPWLLNYDAIPNIVADNTVDERLVDRAVLRVLEQKLRFKSAYLDEPSGLKPSNTTYDVGLGSVTNTEVHAELAQEMAEKAMVLLRNENNALPIGAGITTVAVIGAAVDYTVNSDNPRNKVFNFVTDAALGDRGSSRVRPDPALTTGPLAGLLAAAPAGVEVISGATAAEAANADFVVVIAGLTAGDEGEEYTGASDREDLSLGSLQNTLITDVIALGKPMAVVIEAGAVVDMPWINDVDAAIMAWYPGQNGGAALGRLLFGQTNFAGRLPVTWPESADQFPEFNTGDTTEMDYFVGYRRFDALDLEPLYAFGHGLSYSTFRYERLHIPCAEVSENGLISVSVDVRNTSERAGDEVIQIYASYPESQAPRRSVKELKGFARFHLEAGEGKRVSIPVRVQDLKYWDTANDSWAVESGPVLIQVGPSSDNLLLEQTFTVN